MSEKIKINKHSGSITFTNNGISFSQFGITKEILDLVDNQQQEIERLNNIIDELEKWLLSEQERYRDYLSTRPTNDSEYNSKYATQSALVQLDVVLDKLKELKDSDK